MKLPPSAITGLETAINRYLRLDPDSGRHLSRLAGRCINIHLEGLDVDLYVYPDEHGLQLKDCIDAEADTSLRGTPLALARMGLGNNAEKSLFSGDVVITGDVETGKTFKAILDELDIDWEEQLSQLTGDVVAHQLGNLVRRGRHVLRHGMSTLEQDIGEYLQEELRVLPTRIETENFSSDVSHTSMDVERLQARVKRLQANRNDTA